MKGPCFNCQDRRPGCHGSCEKYQEFRAAIKKANEQKKAETISTMTENKVIKQKLHQKWNDKRKR